MRNLKLLLRLNLIQYKRRDEMFITIKAIEITPMIVFTSRFGSY